MSIKDKLLRDIDLSREGKIITVPISSGKLGRTIFIGQNLYHLIGGAGGSGKSAWTDFHYVLSPYNWMKKQESPIKMKIILRSLERSAKHRVAKWTAMRIAYKYGVLLDVPSMLGWGLSKSRITDEIYNMITESLDYFEQMQDVVEIVDGVENPTGIYRHFEKHALSVGKLYVVKNEDGMDVLTRKTGFGKYMKVDPMECLSCTPESPVYVPNDPNLLTIGIVDHMQAMSGEKDLSEKQVFDKMSRYMRESRDLFGFMTVAVSQLNRGIAETARRAQAELLPEDKDFSGSSNMYNDCDMGAILFNPYKYSMDNILGYRVKDMVSVEGINRLRTFHVLKNTYGPENQIFAYQFTGEIGSFTELPKPHDMDGNKYRELANPNFQIKLTTQTQTQ